MAREIIPDLNSLLAEQNRSDEERVCTEAQDVAEGNENVEMDAGVEKGAETTNEEERANGKMTTSSSSEDAGVKKKKKREVSDRQRAALERNRQKS